MNFEWYIDRGMRLIPILRKQKKPAIKAGMGFSASSIDIEQLRQWEEKFPDCNWAVCLKPSGLVAVDIDREGLERWNTIKREHEPIVTLTQRSGSGHGGHLVFKDDKKGPFKGKIGGSKDEGIHVKWNGFIVVEPSLHPSGKRYKWSNDIKPIEMPDWLRTLCSYGPKSKRPDSAPVPIDPEIDAERWAKMKLMADRLRMKKFGYDEWRKIGMAIHSETGGSDAGLDLFQHITSGVNEQPGDYEAAEYKWNGFSADGAISGTSFDFVYRSHCADEIATDSAAEDFAPVWVKENDKFVAADKDAVVWLLNKAGWCWISNIACAAIVDTSQSPPLLKWRRGEQFRGELAPYGCWIPDSKNIGEVKWKPAIDTWMSSASRKVYKDVVFDPVLSSEEYVNLWAPIPGIPKDGNIEDVLLLLKTLCGGRDDTTEYMIDWCAHLIQKTDEKTSVCPVFVGEQGTGKNMFAEHIMGRILKHTHLVIGSTDAILEPFNSEQAKRFLTVMDEATWSGNEKIVARLKNLTGSETMQINEKFAPQYQIKNFSRYIFLSNTARAVRVETGNRRFLVMESCEVLPPEFFADLGARLDNAAAAWHSFLLDRDISNFKPREFPTHLDTGGTDTKVDSMNPVGQFWFEILTENPKEMWVVVNGEYRLNRSEAFRIYREWLSESGTRKQSTASHFWRITKQYVGEMAIVRGTDNLYMLRVSPSRMREMFMKKNRMAALTSDIELRDSEFIIGAYESEHYFDMRDF
jgi:hypothetical protein